MQTLIERAVAILFTTKLSIEFWGYTIKYIVYLKNRSPIIAIETIPYKALYQKQLDLSYLKTFGCYTWSYIPKERRIKFQ